jgi:hypothetical protein
MLVGVGGGTDARRQGDRGSGHHLTHVFRGGAARLATAGGESANLGKAVESPPPPLRSAPGPSENVER